MGTTDDVINMSNIFNSNIIFHFSEKIEEIKIQNFELLKIQIKNHENHENHEIIVWPRAYTNIDNQNGILLCFVPNLGISAIYRIDLSGCEIVKNESVRKNYRANLTVGKSLPVEF